MANKTKPKKPVKCSICGKSYIGKDALIDHIGRIHTSMIPDGWSPARYENYLRTGKTEGHCVYCKTSTTWNEATGKYNRMCGSEKCKKTAKEIANINYIGKHGKPYSINNPEQQKKMVYGRKNSGKYIFEDEVTGKKYVAMYDSSYGKDFFEMLDTLLNWDGADIIAPSPHTYYYEYEGRKHFYIPDAYSTSLNLEIEIKDGGDNPNNHPKIQAVDKVKEKLKDEVMESLKGEVNYIKICNKDYTEFFAMLSRLREQDTCKLPKWESKLEPALESVTEVGFIYSERLDKFKYYHLETEKKDHPGGWDEEQYFKTLKDAVLQELSNLSYKDIGERKGKATRYVYTLGKDYKAIYLGCINIYWYDWYDRHETPEYEWEETSDINKALIDWELNPIVESCDGRLQPELIPVFYDELKRELNNESVDESTNFGKKKNLVKRYDLLVNPTINYDDLMDYYRKQIFHRNLSKNDRVALYNEINNVSTYLKKVVNGDSENDYRMNYEAKKALKEINGFIAYMEDNQLVAESCNYVFERFAPTSYSVSNVKYIVKKIHDKSVSDEKPPVGNQNCMLCTWCVEAQMRGFNILPRPVYSPRDVIFKHNGYDIVKGGTTLPITNIHDVKSILHGGGNGSRYYVHVKWNGCNSGHEFILMNIDDVIYVVDGQSGTVTTIDNRIGSLYFKDIDFRKSYLVRMDNLPINKEYLSYNDDSYIVEWDNELDIVLLKENLIISESTHFGRFLVNYFESFNDTKEIPIVNPGYEEFLLTHTPSEPVVDKIFGTPENCTTDVLPGRIATAGDFKEYRQYADLDAARGPIEESSMKSNDDDWSNNPNDFSNYRPHDDIFQDIVAFNEKLNNYEYIIPSSRKLTVTADDFMNYYKMLTPTEFETYKGGVCWDYVAYEADYFRKHFPSVKFKSYFVVSINGDTQPSHTFILFNYGGYVYWFESSWKPMHGIYKFKTEEDALNYICKRLREPVVNYKEQYVTTYNPLDRKLFGMNCTEYMGYMEKRLPKNPRRDVKNPKGPIEVITKPLSYSSMESSIVATKSDIQYYPVFIFLSYTDTRMARMIKAFTHDPYSHSSISFDTSLNNMVSFNRDGMVNEDIMSNFFKERSNVVRYSLYMYMATAQEYTAMQNFVNELLGKRDTLKYNLLGLTNFIFGRGSEREDRYFCSEFVASVISAGNDHIIDRKPYMVSPYYFAKNKNFIFIKTGLLKNYDENEVNNIISKKLERSDFDVTIE